MNGKSFTVKFLPALLIPLIIVFAGWFFSESSFLSLLEWQSVDLRFKARGALPPDPEIMIIGVDESTFKELKLKYPFPPVLYAQLIQKLDDGGAFVIAFDFLYSEPTRECDPPDQDRILAETIKERGTVIWGFEMLEDGSAVKPIPIIEEAVAGLGFLNLPDEIDRRIRRFSPEMKGLYSFDAAIVKEYAGLIPPQWKSDELHLINFRGPAGTFPVTSMVDVLNDRISEEDISGKICIIGATFVASHDTYATPFHKTSIPDMFGIEIHANIIGNMLRNDRLEFYRPWWLWMVLLTLSIIVSLNLFYWKPWLSVPLWLFFSALWFGGALYLFLNNMIILLFTPLLILTASFWSSAFYSYMLERKRRKEIKMLFSSYVDPTVVDWLIKHPEEVSLGGEKCVLTVLDTDIEGFTTITANMDPQDLVHVLNLYFDVLTEAVLSQGGMIDKYIGDALMVIYGFPVKHKDHALRAYNSAKLILERVEKLNEDLKANNLPALKTRIGICTGECIIGSMGGQDRKTVTAMGDAANLASRIEAINKEYGTQVMMSGSTADMLPEEIKNRLFHRGEVSLRGFEKKVQLYNADFDPSINISKEK